MTATKENKYYNDRKNVVYKKQGEWFFVPMPDYFKVPEDRVLKHEPLVRGGGKLHTCEYLYRVNGILVYVCIKFPNGLTQLQYDEHIHAHPEDKKLGWHTTLRDPQVAVMGKITHPDHKTLILPWWHRVATSAEANAPMRVYNTIAV